MDPADLYAMYFDGNTIGQHLNKLKYEQTGGRASEAPKFHNVSMSIDECNLIGLWRKGEWLEVIAEAVRHNSSNVKACNE